jgi:GTP-binding protein HflX
LPSLPLNAEDRERGVAYLIGVLGPGQSEAELDAHLDELASLADTAGFRVCGRCVLPVRKIQAGTFIGRGQADDVAVMATGLGATIAIFDEPLSPAQARNLEQRFDLPVVDRPGLIIDIFAQRARSREARTQVEIAQLEYLLPRLAGRWSHLSRQVGGGPGGTKGEGEKQIELDRRMIRRRIDRLRRELARLQRGRGVRRQARRGMPQAAFVGYTNVGKSSLFNRLCHAGVAVENRLFATLDPTTRRVDLGGRGAFLLKDTVGFIRKLPHDLVAAFRSTFEEAGEADLLVIVLDASHPDIDEQQRVVESVLEETGVREHERLIVYNKIDRLTPVQRRGLPAGSGVTVSAATGEGIEELRERLADRLLGREWVATLEIPRQDGDLVARAQRLGQIESCETVDGVMRLKLRARNDVLEDLERRIEERRS